MLASAISHEHRKQSRKKRNSRASRNNQIFQVLSTRSSWNSLKEHEPNPRGSDSARSRSPRKVLVLRGRYPPSDRLRLSMSFRALYHPCWSPCPLRKRVANRRACTFRDTKDHRKTKKSCRERTEAVREEEWRRLTKTTDEEEREKKVKNGNDFKATRGSAHAPG